MKEMILYFDGMKAREKTDNWTIKLTKYPTIYGKSLNRQSTYKVEDKDHPLYGVEFINTGSKSFAWSTIEAKHALYLANNKELPIKVAIADDYDSKGGNRVIIKEIAKWEKTQQDKLVNFGGINCDKNQLDFAISKEGKYKIQIFDSHGKIYNSLNIIELGVYSIDISKYESGIYFFYAIEKNDLIEPYHYKFIIS